MDNTLFFNECTDEEILYGIQSIQLYRKVKSDLRLQGIGHKFNDDEIKKGILEFKRMSMESRALAGEESFEQSVNRLISQMLQFRQMLQEVKP